MESLNVVPVSKQAAKQRAGRAGRTVLPVETSNGYPSSRRAIAPQRAGPQTPRHDPPPLPLLPRAQGPGVCLRLYSEKRMEKEFPAETAPEILRTNLASTILTLKASLPPHPTLKAGCPRPGCAPRITCEPVGGGGAGDGDQRPAVVRLHGRARHGQGRIPLPPLLRAPSRFPATVVHARPSSLSLS